MTDLRTAAQQALEAICSAKLCEFNSMSSRREMVRLMDEATDILRAALAQQAEPVLQTCNCRWDGEVQVQQCTLHEAHIDAIHEWAERAKVAERKLAQQAEPVQEPVAWANIDSDRLRVDPATGNVSIGAQQAEPVEPRRWEGDHNVESPFNACMHKSYCITLKQALAQQALEEPMAWAYMGIKQDGTEHGPHLVWKPEYMDFMSASKGAKAIPLYTPPPQRLPLTDEEAAALIELDPRMLTEFGTAASGAAMELIRRTERALEEKNRGR